MLDSRQLQTELAPSVFALAKGQVTLNPERGRLPTLRWQMDGIRTVVCINAESVKEFMAKHGLRQSTPESVQEFIKSLSKDAFDTFMESSAVIYCTLSPGDALFTPFDTIFFERVGSAADVCGLRLTTAFYPDSDAMTRVHRWLISVHRANSFLANAVDLLAGTG